MEAITAKDFWESVKGARVTYRDYGTIRYFQPRDGYRYRMSWGTDRATDFYRIREWE